MKIVALSALRRNSSREFRNQPSRQDILKKPLDPFKALRKISLVDCRLRDKIVRPNT